MKSTEFSDKNSGVERKSMVQFKDTPEEIKSSSESPTIGKQPPRRSLLMTPVAPATPGARSTPFRRSVIDTDDGRKDSIGRGAGMKPRRSEQMKPFHEPVQGPISHPSSIIDVKIPYVNDAPTSNGPYKNPTNRDQNRFLLWTTLRIRLIYHRVTISCSQN